MAPRSHFPAIVTFYRTHRRMPTYREIMRLAEFRGTNATVKGLVQQALIRNVEKPSVVAANLIQTLSWKKRKVQFIDHADPTVMEQVIVRLIPLIGADRIIENFLSEGPPHDRHSFYPLPPLRYGLLFIPVKNTGLSGSYRNENSDPCIPAKASWTPHFPASCLLGVGRRDSSPLTQKDKRGGAPAVQLL